MESKGVTNVWRLLKILIFLSFVYTSIIMFKLKDTTTAILILFAISFFLILNKIDSINKRLKILEVK